MRNATSPCLDAFCRLNQLGLSVTCQRIESDHTVLCCRPTTPPSPCPGCAGQGVCHDSVTRRLVHVPYGWKPTILEVVVPRYKCRSCRRVWRHDIRTAAPSQGKLSRDAVIQAVKSIVVDRIIARVATNLGVAWNTACDAILAAGNEVIHRQCWPPQWCHHTRGWARVVTHPSWRQDASLSSVGLTVTRTKTGSSRLLAVVEGRSKQAFNTWLETQTEEFRKKVENCRDGRLGRLQNRRGRSDRGRAHRDGPLPRRWPGRRQPLMRPTRYPEASMPLG